MKKWCVIFGILLFLSGCAAQPTFETVDDIYEPLTQPAAQIRLTLGADAALTTMSSDQSHKLYFCNGYTVSVQTLAGGDLDSTFRAVTGYDREKLTVLQQTQGNIRRYDCAWTCAGEGGDQSCRAAVLDDGNYHYVLSVMAGAADAGDCQEAWNSLFSSFSLGNTAP